MSSADSWVPKVRLIQSTSCTALVGAFCTSEVIWSTSSVPSAPKKAAMTAIRPTNTMPVAGPRRMPRAASQFTAGSMAKARNSEISRMVSRLRSRSSIHRPNMSAQTVTAASRKARTSHGGVAMSTSVREFARGGSFLAPAGRGRAGAFAACGVPAASLPAALSPLGVPPGAFASFSWSDTSRTVAIRAARRAVHAGSLATTWRTRHGCPRGSACRSQARIVGLDGGGVDDEPVAHVAVDHPVVGVVDLVGGDDLDLGADAVLGAELQHLLGLGDAADHGTGQRAPERGQMEAAQGGGVLRHAELDEGAVAAQQAQILLHRQVGGDGVEDQVEAVAQLAEGLVVGGGVVVVGAEALAVLLLAQRMAQHRDLGAHRRGQLDADVAEPAHADDRHPLARPGRPVPQRGEQGDARAQQR